MITYEPYTGYGTVKQRDKPPKTKRTFCPKSVLADEGTDETELPQGQDRNTLLSVLVTVRCLLERDRGQDLQAALARYPPCPCRAKFDQFCLGVASSCTRSSAGDEPGDRVDLDGNACLLCVCLDVMDTFLDTLVRSLCPLL